MNRGLPMTNACPKHPRPQWMQALPLQFQELLEEVYVLIEQGPLRFVPGGLRTLVELLGREVLGESLSFGKMPGALHERHLASAAERDRLAEVLAGAHAAVHDGTLLSRGAVLHMLLCVERLLQNCFVLSQPHAELREVAARREAGRRG
ncbi:hypothetical protein [Stigmatella aurantiaca]|nr:hypothetical protein [Stigmatella aurantiaca]